MGQLIPYSTRRETNIVTILHLYGARSIFILVCNYKDTQSESCEMIIGVAGPILTHKNIKKSMGKKYPYPTRLEETVVEIIHDYGDRAIILLICDNQDTKSKSKEI